MNPHAISLILIDQSITDDVSASPERFEKDQGLRFGAPHELVQSVVIQNEAMLQRSKCDWQWGGYFALAAATPTIVGVCSFKGKPIDRTIEIAYFTFPEYEGRGFATAMARALIERARTYGSISTIVAHTLPKQNASCRILEKVGLTMVGDAEDEDAGSVWRWEMRLFAE